MSKHSLALIPLLLSSGLLLAQMPTSSQPGALQALPSLPSEPAKELSIFRDTQPGKPFTVTGPRGAVLGQQDGTFEAWIFPWKVLSNMRITVDMQDYPVPIDVNEHAATIDVRPDHTTITFSHANFTIRETLFAPQHAPDGTGALAFFQIAAVRPMTLTFHFTPEMRRMWPALADDHPSPEWVKTGDSGFYILHLTTPDHAAAFAIPQAVPGVLSPYQERPKTYPLEFVLHFDPSRDSEKVFPLLMTTADSITETTSAALAGKLRTLQESFQKLYLDTQAHYRDLLASRLSIETPDSKLNEAFGWAELAIDQLQVETTPARVDTALVAGFYSSGDSSRPGFGWFFGRDALWTLYAVNSYGDFGLTRRELEFLIRRQRADGKILHEWSQTADLLDWKSQPYAYASADATLLFLMAIDDYLRVSGDKEFVRSHWDALVRAWDFERSHDSDGDGVYDNSEGTGWVESWPPGMPHQEIYVAVLDQQASSAMAHLAQSMGHADIAKQAQDRAVSVASTLEKEYLPVDKKFYAFSRNADGTTDSSPTIYPSVASWDGSYKLPHAEPMLSRWASSEFSTDWGTRDLSPTVSFYDPISYHQGTVWPLFTGWVSLAEYRNGRSLAGYAHMMQNANLTWAQDLGAVTELLSGQFYAPLGRSSSHQLWSSAMVISPIMRGLFGVEWDAERNTLTITPSIPAEWEHAKLLRLPLGVSTVDLEISREGSSLLVRASGGSSSNRRLDSHTPGAKYTAGVLRIPLPAVEAGIESSLPDPGSATHQLKVLDQVATSNSLTLRLSAPAQSKQELYLRINDRTKVVHTDDAHLVPRASPGLTDVEVDFGPGTGYVDKTVTFRW